MSTSIVIAIKSFILSETYTETCVALFLMEKHYPSGQLIQHSKYSAMLSKIHSTTECFFGDFAHWDVCIIPSGYFQIVERLAFELRHDKWI